MARFDGKGVLVTGAAGALGRAVAAAFDGRRLARRSTFEVIGFVDAFRRHRACPMTSSTARRRPELILLVTNFLLFATQTGNER